MSDKIKLTDNTTGLQAILGKVNSLPDAGSGSTEPVIQPLSVTENGTYTAPDGVDGYSPVVVNVAGSGGDTSVEDGLITRTLTEYTNNRVTTIGENAFRTSTARTTVSLPNVTTTDSSAFYGCTALLSAHLPALQKMGVMLFYGCTSLETIELPSLTTTSSQAMRNCSKLKKADLGSPTSLVASCFNGCSLLETLIIRTNSLCTLGNTTAISGTKIEAGTDYVYVPSALVATYKGATNWSGFASQIRAIEDYPNITGG